MSAGSQRRHFLLSTTVLVGALTAYGRGAYAACVSTPPDPPNVFVCSDLETTPQAVTFNNADVSTADNFEVDTIAGDALTITGSGAIAFRDENASPLTTGDGDALVVQSNGITGSVTIETNGKLVASAVGINAFNIGLGAMSITANGDIESEFDTGIDAFNWGSDLTVTTGGTITALNVGIDAENRGNGATLITVNGDITTNGGLGFGIRAHNGSMTPVTTTSLSVITDSGTTIDADTFGIDARNYGYGTLTVTAKGQVTGGSNTGIHAQNGNATLSLRRATDITVRTEALVTGGNYGIYALNYGTGAIDITATGDVIGGSLLDSAGILASNVGGSGRLAITANGKVEGTTGIRASNSSSGGLQITATGDIESLTVPNGIGISATDNGAGNLQIEANNVAGYSVGIDAENSGGGALSITSYGDVEANGDGINAMNAAIGTDLTIETRGVTRGSFGILANNFGSGSSNITTRGGVEAGNTGINAFVSGAGTDLRIAVENNVIGGNVGIVANNLGSGVLEIAVDGAVTGNLVNGIDASHEGGGPIQIAVSNGASVTSNGALPSNFAIVTDGGATDLLVAGTLNGGAGGAVRFDQNADLGDRLELHTTAVVNGNVLAGGGTDSFVLGGSGAASFNVAGIGATAQFRSFELFAKEGASHWQLTGTNSEIGNFAVNGGLLSVNGALPNAAFTVNGGTLGGTGTIGSLAVASNAVFAPGNSIGTMTVNGPFTLKPGAVFEVEVNAAGQSDRVVVQQGTVNLTGSVLRVLAASGSYKLRTDYLIVDNDGTDAVVGTFSSVTTNLAFLTPSVNYRGGTGNDVVLTLLNRNIGFCSVAETKNQCSVANALDLFPGDDPLFLAVLTQTAAGARQAFDALSGEIHATLPGMLADESRYVREAVLGRLMQASYTGQLAALSAGGPQTASPNSQAMTLGSDSEAMRLGSDRSLAMPPADPGLAFWTRAYGAWGDFDGNGNAASAERDLGGFVSGLDAQVSGTWRLGLAAGGAWSNVSIAERYSTADVESFNLAAYAGGMAGPLALRAGGAYAWQDIETTRAVIFPGFFERQEASYDADTGQLFGEIAYPIASGRIAFEPFAGLAWVNVDTERFREHGGALSALNGASSDQDVGYSTVGLRAATAMHWGGMLIVPKISAAWQHAFDDVTPGAALAFASTGIGFGITGVPLAEDSLLIEAGLDLALSPNATLGVSYSGQHASEVSDNAVKGRLTWLF